MVQKQKQKQKQKLEPISREESAIPNYWHYKKELKKFAKEQPGCEFRFIDLPVDLRVDGWLRRASNDGIVRKKRTECGRVGGWRNVWTIAC